MDTGFRHFPHGRGGVNDSRRCLTFVTDVAPANLEMLEEEDPGKEGGGRVRAGDDESGRVMPENRWWSCEQEAMGGGRRVPVYGVPCEGFGQGGRGGKWCLGGGAWIKDGLTRRDSPVDPVFQVKQTRLPDKVS